MPMKTCPACNVGVGVRTLKCKCGFDFKHFPPPSELAKIPTKLPGLPPRITPPRFTSPQGDTKGTKEPFPDKPTTRVSTTDGVYDEQYQAVLTDGANPVGADQRPISTIFCTKADLESLIAGACVPATIMGAEVYLKITVRERP